MPTTSNKNFQALRPIPDGISPNTEVFYQPSTNEIFENYDDYFERMIQLNSSCWSCTMTGKTGLTYEEALHSEAKASTSKTGISKAEIRRKKIIEQQKQLRPLFETAENHGVENIERWQQTFQFLSNEDIQELRNAISVAKSDEKAALRKQQIEERRKQRELIAEWRKPRDDLLCDDLKPFPSGYRELCWPDWVPRELYWDILTVQCFFENFAEVLFHDRKNPFTLTNIATAIVSNQETEKTQFYQILNWIMTAMNASIKEEEGDPTNLLKHDNIGNENVKDFDNPINGDAIRRISKDCERHKKNRGVNVRALVGKNRDITKIIRLHLKRSDGYTFSHSEYEILEILKKSSIYALNTQQRVKLFNLLINQLLSHRRCRTLISKRTEEMNELKRELRQLKFIDQQHQRESREAYQFLSQQRIGFAQKSNEKSKEVSQQLSNLRRALMQLNEGRRVQNISEIKEQLLRESLPWTQMENINEVLEFRAAQRNFHSDRVKELIQQIFELQGKMGLYFLGRDRAFRGYYYMCSTFIIHCPSTEECGTCDECLTPKTIEHPTQLIISDDKNDDYIQILDSDDVAISGKIKYENDGNINKVTNCIKVLSNGDELNTVTDEEKEKQNDAVDLEGFADVDPLMVCTGKKDCPVHNPSSGRLLYYIERDAVNKLINALNPRGFRESELSENISFFKEIYTKEMNDFLDVLKDRHLQQPLSFKLFGFNSAIPKELVDGKEEVRSEDFSDDDVYLQPKNTRHSYHIEHFDGFGALRYEGLARQRRAVTHYDPSNFDNFGALRYEGLARQRKAVTHYDPANYAGTSDEIDNKNELRDDNVDNEWLIDDDDTQQNEEIEQNQKQPDEILLEEWQQLG